MNSQVLLIELSGSPDVFIANALEQCGYQVVNRLATLDGMIQQLKNHRVDFLIITTNAPNNILLNHVKLVMRESPLAVVVFSDTSTKTLTIETIEAGVSAFVVDGCRESRLKHVMELAEARYKQCLTNMLDLQNAKAQLVERKRIDTAKAIIMKRRTIDEASALLVIKKMALDRKQKLIDVAENIINVDTLLN